MIYDVAILIEGDGATQRRFIKVEAQSELEAHDRAIAEVSKQWPTAIIAVSAHVGGTSSPAAE
jgi:hypothetical protein